MPRPNSIGNACSVTLAAALGVGEISILENYLLHFFVYDQGRLPANLSADDNKCAMDNFFFFGGGGFIISLVFSFNI